MARTLIRRVARSYPPEVRDVIQAAIRNEAVMTAASQPAMFTSETAAVVAGMAATAKWRYKLEEALDAYFERKRKEAAGSTPDRLIVGAGLHATTLALSLKDDISTGIITKDDAVGGIFAAARRPVFWLNSRNRRPDAGERVPGKPGALNWIEGGILQPSDLNGREYQSQDDFALAIRFNLMYALETRNIKLYGGRVRGLQENDGYYALDISGRRTMQTPRRFITEQVILATGVGEPANGQANLLTFPQFLRMADQNDLPPGKTVAVFGAGDSGKVVVEYLLGQGPTQPPLWEQPTMIEWFGQRYMTKTELEQNNRSRYAGIARFMPREDRSYAYRVRSHPGRPLQINRSYAVDARGTMSSFDYGILATGFQNETPRSAVASLVGPFGRLFEPLRLPDITVAMRVPDEEVYVVGPAADIPIEPTEYRRSPVLRTIPENSAAAFRYVERTRRFGEWLGQKGVG
jgi:hypothetical protein